MKLKPMTIAAISVAALALAGVAYASSGSLAKGPNAAVTEPAGQELNDQQEVKSNLSPVEKPDSAKDSETNDDGQPSK